MSEAAVPTEAGTGGESGAALQTTETTTTGGGWLDSIDADLRGNETLGRFKSTTDLAKSYLEVRSKVGEKGLTLPKPDADPAEVRAAMTALGCPETPDGYDLGDFQPPEGVPWDPAFQGDALAMMHGIGMNSAQAQRAIAWFADRSKQAFEGQSTTDSERHAEWDADMAKRWGKAGEKRWQLANRAFQLGLGESGESVANARLEGGGLLRHHPAFREMMANVGDLLSEHQLLGDSEPNRFTNTPENAKKRIEELSADKDFQAKLFNQDRRDPGHLAAAEEWRRLHDLAYPTSEAEVLTV